MKIGLNWVRLVDFMFFRATAEYEGGLAAEERQKTGVGNKIRKAGRQERAKAPNSKLHPPPENDDVYFCITRDFNRV